MMIMIMMHNTQNCWVSGLCPSSLIPNNYKARCFGNWICFHLQVGVTSLLRPIEWATSEDIQKSRFLPRLTWGQKQIKFPKRCVIRTKVKIQDLVNMKKKFETSQKPLEAWVIIFFKSLEQSPLKTTILNVLSSDRNEYSLSAHL
jgi:hypothetical protein